MKNMHLPASAGWQVLACPLANLVLFPCAHFFQKAGKNCLVMLVVLLYTTNCLFAQTTWTGATSTAWNTASNWSAGVPDANDDVSIPNVTNDPTISVAGAVAKSITVDLGGALSIGAAGTLTLNSSTTQAILNQGTVTNSGDINIGSTLSVGSYGIRNEGTFNNNTGGSISIDRSTANGFINNAGTFTNAATLTIGSLADVGMTGISNSATINNNAGGTINIDRSTIWGIRNFTGTFNNAATINIGASVASSMDFGIENNNAFSNSGSGQINIDRSTSFGILNSTGTFTNAATLHIGSTAAVGTRCIYNQGTFSNNTGGTINANNASLYGIEHISGTFTNAGGTINIGSLSAVGTHGLKNAATLNNTGGQINIDRSTSYGIWNNTGTFTNAATLTIGSIAAVGTRCIYNETTFNNNTGGVINANNSSLYGIEHFSGTFTNAGGTINIGSSSAVGTSGLRNSSTFNNNAGGQINIDRSTSAGLANSAGTFTNAATLTIGSVADVGMTGISNSATINNNAGGTVNIDRSTIWGIRNFTGTFHNAATISIGTSAASSMDFGIENSTAFSNSGSGQINIDRSSSFGILNNTGTFTNAATLYIGSTAAVGTSCIYNDGTFSNNTGGAINVNHASLYGIQNNSGTFTNQAAIKIGEITPVPALFNGSGGAFSNGTGGILQGTGSIDAEYFTNAGGTLSPGYSPGLQSFTADENFSNSTLRLEMAGSGGVPGTDFDQITVTGTATLSTTSTDLQLVFGYAAVNGTTFDLVTATSISGTIAAGNVSVINTGAGNVTSVSLSYPANNKVRVTVSSIALPVEMVDFQAVSVNRDNKPAVLLTWQTASEQNNEGFHVERSINGRNWQSLTFVPGNGTTTEAHNYSFLDEKPLLGQNYYRLRQADFDENYKYSNIVSLEVVGKENYPVLFPNPASTAVQVRFSQEFTEGKLDVFDVAGRLVLSQDMEAGSQSVQLGTADLASGTYVCRFQLDGAVFLERLQIQ